jgi:hypothetical protein
MVKQFQSIIWSNKMAEDYRLTKAFPSFKQFTGSTGWTEIKLPSNCSRVQVGSTQALYVSNTGTDGEVPASEDHKGFIIANNYLTFLIGRGSTRDSVIFVAGQSGTPTISIIMEE